MNDLPVSELASCGFYWVFVLVTLAATEWLGDPQFFVFKANQLFLRASLRNVSEAKPYGPAYAVAFSLLALT